MKINIPIGKVILLSISMTLAGCLGIEERIILPTETSLPTSTSLPTQTPLPSATITSLPTPSQTPLPPPPQEVPVQVIPLTGPIASPDAQISGMAWYGDTLVILPQYPERIFPQTSNKRSFPLLLYSRLDCKRCN